MAHRLRPEVHATVPNAGTDIAHFGVTVAKSVQRLCTAMTHRGTKGLEDLNLPRGAAVDSRELQVSYRVVPVCSGDLGYGGSACARVCSGDLGYGGGTAQECSVQR
eukprot:3941217-Rhodomonas_salina.7